MSLYQLQRDNLRGVFGFCCFLKLFSGLAQQTLQFFSPSVQTERGAVLRTPPRGEER